MSSSPILHTCLRPVITCNYLWVHKKRTTHLISLWAWSHACSRSPGAVGGGAGCMWWSWDGASAHHAQDELTVLQPAAPIHQLQCSALLEITLKSLKGLSLALSHCDCQAAWRMRKSFKAYKKTPLPSAALDAVWQRMGTLALPVSARSGGLASNSCSPEK